MGNFFEERGRGAAHYGSGSVEDADCPDKVIYAIGGWSDGRKRTVANGYGSDGYRSGLSIAKLKRWLDEIGF
jgi:hypothetical protein